MTARIRVNDRRPMNPLHPKPKKLHTTSKASMKAPARYNQMIPEFPDEAPKRVTMESATATVGVKTGGSRVGGPELCV